MKVRKGFTLIELLIVLAIIGVLMSIGIPVYTNQLQKAKARVTAANLVTIAQAAANLAMLGEDISSLGSGSITELVKGIKNSGNYSAAATKDSNTATWDIYVYYTGTDIPTKMIAEEVDGTCDGSAVSEDASGNIIKGSATPACVLLNIPSVGF